MRGYDGEEVEEYDEYEDEGEEQYEEDEEGEEEIEEEERKPTEEELEYLESRKRLKEHYRKKFKKENSSALSSSQHKKNILPYDNYGSFFGPSEPVISQRVIQESKSFLETLHLANRVSHSHRGNENMSATTAGSKAGVPRQLPKLNQLQTKVDKIKVSRDYSFLSNDAELPAAKKDPPARNISRPNSVARSAQLPIKNKQLLGNNGRNVQGAREERRPISSNGQMHSKAGPYKSTSASKPNLTSVDYRKQHSSSNGSGPGRPGPKPLPSKIPVASMMKKASASGAKNVLPSAKVPPSSKMPPSVQKKHLEQRKSLEEPNRHKMVPKQLVSSSKPQLNKPPKQISSRPMTQDHRLKKKPLRRFPDDERGDDNAVAFNMLRNMLGPRKFANYDDDDDSDMEAGFDDIMQEEIRSANIARREDEEQLRLIEEEERQERKRKLEKKRKLSQRH